MAEKWDRVVAFAGAAGVKFVENVLSVKVWIIFIYMMLSLFMVHKDKMTGEIFATSNGSVISIVLALREGFKTQKIKAIANGSSEDAKKEMKKMAA
jgi:hypothetical protein